MSNSYDWENNKKIYKKVHDLNFWEKKLFLKSSKQDGCYLVLRKFNTEVAFSIFFEKLWHLTIDQKIKE